MNDDIFEEDPNQKDSSLMLDRSEYFMRIMQGRTGHEDDDDYLYLEENRQLKPSTTEINAIKDKVIELNKRLVEQTQMRLRFERTAVEQESRISSYKQQNQNLIKEIERLQCQTENNSAYEQQIQNYRDDLQGLRTRIIQEINMKNKALQQYEDEKEAHDKLKETVSEQKSQLNFKNEEVKQLERVLEQFKSEFQIIKKKNNQLEEQLAETKAQYQSTNDENQSIKNELTRQKDQVKHLQVENSRLRKELDLIKTQNSKLENKLDEQKQNFEQRQMFNDENQKSEQVTKLQYLLNNANQEINKYRSMLNQGALNNDSLERRQASPPRQYQQQQQPYSKQQNHFSPPRTNDRRSAPFNNPALSPVREQWVGQNFQNLQYIYQEQPPRQQAYETNKIQPQNSQQQLGTLKIGNQHLENLEQIHDIENELMNLQLRKSEIEGQIQKMETQKLRTQTQLTRRKKLEQDLETTCNQIQTLRKNLRNYNALK